MQKHNENIENLINSGIDGLIVHLGDPEQMAPFDGRGLKRKESGHHQWRRLSVAHTIGDVNGDDPLMATLASDALLASIRICRRHTLCGFRSAAGDEKRIFEAVAADYPDVKIHEVPAEHNPRKSADADRGRF